MIEAAGINASAALGRSCHILCRVLSLSASTFVSNSINLQGGLKIIMTIETMVREFRYDEIRLPDPNPRLSVDEVRTAFSATYPEIATAALTGPEAVGNKLVYHFAKAIGTKG
jgi:PRTRC genetic system protein C